VELDYTPTKQDVIHFNWCVKNSIRVYPKPVERGFKNKLYYICIEVNKNEHCDDKVYDPMEITSVAYKYYKYYYDKYNKQV